MISPAPMLQRALAFSGLAHAPVSPMSPWGEDPRSALRWAASEEIRTVQLDAAAPGLRPRELGSSARRDLAAILRRSGIACSGLDLWIPAAHFTDPARIDRAFAALQAAIGLIADLDSLGAASPGGCVVCTELGNCPGPVVADLRRDAERHGVLLADCRWPPDSAPHAGLCVDPAAILAVGAEPAAALSKLSAPPAAARLTDLSSRGVRCEPESPGGRLDVLAYEATLVTIGFRAPLVFDPRDLPDQLGAVRRVLKLSH